jgi:hypothetical protein
MKSKFVLFALITGSFFVTSCEDILNDPSSGDIAQKIEGSWKCDENSSIFKSTEDIYSVYITPDDSDSTLVHISNFYALGNNVEAAARISDHAITLQTQTLSGDYEIHGSGTISNNLKEISWKYFVDDGSGVIDEVDAIYTLQY